MDDYSDIKLTKREAQAIARLQKLADTWPESLTLFSQSGHLVVLKPPSDDVYCTLQRYTVANINGIRNDGGDADY